MEGFNKRQLFEFDLNGFVIIRNFLSDETVKRMNNAIDRFQDGKHVIKFPFLDLDDVFLDVLTMPQVVAICRELFGLWFRLDSAWGFQEVPPYVGDAKEGLHAGPMSDQESFFYQWRAGKPYCTQANFSYILADANENDGGFMVVPGSHKTNLPYAGSDIVNDILIGDLNADWLVQPQLKAGDLLIFSEAVIHGTRAWKPKDRMRRNLYYKYCPGYMIWTKYEQMKKYAALARNELEGNILREPYVGYYDDTEKPVWQNVYRTQTAPYEKPSIVKRIKNKIKRDLLD